MKVLELQQNKLDGTIPQSLCLIGDSLTVLYLYGNDLTGECASGCCMAVWAVGLERGVGEVRRPTPNAPTR